MPRGKLTTPDADAQFRAAVGQVMDNNAERHDAWAKQMVEGTNIGAQETLRALVDRIETLETEKAETAEAIKEVYAEARGDGFDVKVLRLVVRRRKRRRQEVLEEDEAVQLYEGQLE